MNIECTIGNHNWKKVYPDQDLIDSIIFVQPIEEIWVCSQCGKAQKRPSTVGKIVSH